MAKLLPPVLCPSSTTRSIYLQCFAFTLFQYAVAYPVERQSARPRSHPNDSCGFEGNSDIYGLGIRLGIYLQWTASLLSKRFLISSDLKIMREILGANIIFLLSIFISMALLSSGYVGNVYNVEVLIMHHIFFGGAFMVSYDQLLGGTRGASVTFWGVATMATIATGMATHTIWFWESGVDKLPNPDCGSFAFAFCKVPLRASYTRGLFQTAAIVNMSLWGCGFLWLFFWVFLPLMYSLLTIPGFPISAALDRLRDRREGNAGEPSAKWRDRNQGHGRYVLASIIGGLGTSEAERAKKAPGGANPAKPKSSNIVWPFINLLILAYSVIAIELIIKWNSIRQVYTVDSTGQVIPLVIGAAILIKTLFAIVAHRLNESPFCPDNESFRLRCSQRWVSFPIHKPERRHSWTGKEDEKQL